MNVSVNTTDLPAQLDEAVGLVYPRKNSATNLWPTLMTGNVTTAAAPPPAPYLTFENHFGPTVASHLSRVMLAMDLIACSCEHEELFRFFLSVNQNMMLAESFFPVENSLKGDTGLKPYRDHLLHPAIVFVLGSAIINADGGHLRKVLASLAKESEIGKELANIVGNAGPANLTLDDWESAVEQAWVIAAFGHDLFFLLEPSVRLEAKFFDHPLFHNRGITGLAGLQRYLFDRLRTCRPQPEMTGFLKSHFVKPLSDIAKRRVPNKQRFDHGQCMAAILVTHFLMKSTQNGLPPQKKLPVLLALLAIFRHDDFSRPEKLQDLRAEEDPFSIFLALIDLMAEIRLVWDKVECQKTNAFRSKWSIDIWVPFDTIGLAVSRMPRTTGKCFRLTFQRNKDDANIATGAESLKGFDFGIAAGAGDNPSAVKKRGQYETMMTLLGFLSGDDRLEVDLAKS